MIVLVGAAAAGILLNTPKQSSTTSSSGVSQSSSTASFLKITYESLVVGYQGGLFQLAFQDLEGKQIAGIVVILNIPVLNTTTGKTTTLQAAMCSGGAGTGLGFGNCLPGPGKSYVSTPAAGGSFPANATFTGFDSGTGPGAAIPGKSYPLSITITYADGTSATENLSVKAESG